MDIETYNERYMVRVIWEGELLSLDPFTGTEDEALAEFDAVLEFLPKHYPDTSGISLMIYRESDESVLAEVSL